MAAKIADEVWEQFLGHLERLGTVRAASLVAGMPSDVSVRAKIKTDPNFARRAHALWKKTPRSKKHPKKYDQAVWDQFLAHLEKHKTVLAVSKLEGMPAAATVYFRMERDPVFAGQVTALWKKHCSNPRHHTGTDWYAFLDKLSNLGTPLLVCGLPNMPSYQSYKSKRRLDPLFASRVDALWTRREIGDAAWEELLENLTRFGIREACAQPGAPSYGALHLRRHSDSAFDARVRAIIRDPANRHLHQLRMGDFDWDEFLEIAANSRSMTAVYAHALPGMPGEATVLKRARTHPAFRSALADIVRRQTKARIAALAMASKRKRPLKAKRSSKHASAATFRVALSRDELYAAVASAVPKSLPPITRDDIICDMMLAVLEGQIEIDQIKARTKDFIRDHWRMFGTLRDKSLDAALYNDGVGTLGDQLAGHGADYW